MAASPDTIAEVLVEPEGLDWDDSAADGAADGNGDAADSSGGTAPSLADEVERDPLLELFRTGATLTKERFLLDLEKHQLAGSPGSASQLNLNKPIIYQRWEPRLSVSQPIAVWGQDRQESLPQTTSLIDVSHRGARVGGVAFQPKTGEVVHLVSDGVDARFRVIWVGEVGTPQEGQIGLQSLNPDN
jgi:hypothetical protein